MTIRRTLCILVTAVCLVGLGYAVGHWYPWPAPKPKPGEKDEPAESTALSTIEAQGRLEPISGTLAVGAIPGDTIRRLDVRVGQEVSKGTELAILGSAELRTAERVLAERQLEKAKIQFAAEKSLAQTRQELAKISEQQAEARKKEIPLEESIDVGKQRLALAEARLKKLEQMQSDPQTQEAVADADLEQQRLLIRQITIELAENTGKLEAAQTTQGLAMSAAKLDSDMAQTSFQSLQDATPLPVLEQSVELAKLAEEASKVRAPCDGTILEVYIREGERVANTPILQMGDLRQMVCVAEVHEECVRRLDVKRVPDAAGGAQLVPARDYAVTMESPALTQDLHGKVIEIGRLVGAPALRDPNPLAQTDRRTVRVRISLDEASKELADRFVQLQVNVTIHLQ